MKAFFRRLLAGSGRTIEHEVFGKATLIETKSGAYWEAELQLDGRVIGVGVETANGEAPTSAQVQFYRDITRDLGAAFARAAPALVPRYEEWVGQPFPSDWRSAFKLVGLSIPLNGDDKCSATMILTG